VRHRVDVLRISASDTDWRPLPFAPPARRGSRTARSESSWTEDHRQTVDARVDDLRDADIGLPMPVAYLSTATPAPVRMLNRLVFDLGESQETELQYRSTSRPKRGIVRRAADTGGASSARRGRAGRPALLDPARVARRTAPQQELDLPLRLRRSSRAQRSSAAELGVDAQQERAALSHGPMVQGSVFDDRLGGALAAQHHQQVLTIAALRSPSRSRIFWLASRSRPSPPSRRRLRRSLARGDDGTGLLALHMTRRSRPRRPGG